MFQHCMRVVMHMYGGRLHACIHNSSAPPISAIIGQVDKHSYLEHLSS